jgi:ribosomal protein S13
MAGKKYAGEAIWQVQLVAVLRTARSVRHSMRLSARGQNTFAYTCKVPSSGICKKGGFGGL